jgi:hypothetical protein
MLGIFPALLDMWGVQQFQSEVLEAIGNVSLEMRDQIIRRLTESNRLRRCMVLCAA